MRYENKKDFFNSLWGLNFYDVWVMWISPIPQIKFRNVLFSLKIKDETLAQICDSQELGCGKKQYKYDSPWILQKLAALWKVGEGRGGRMGAQAWCSPHPHADGRWGCSVLPCLPQLSFPLALCCEADSMEMAWYWRKCLMRLKVFSHVSACGSD